MDNRPWSATARSRATRRTTRIVIAAAALACTSMIAPAVALAASSPSSLDSSFGTAGKVATLVGTGSTGEGIKALVADNGGYLAVGSGTDGSGNVELTVTRYSATGALDTTYGTSGMTSLGSAFFPSGEVFFAEGAAVQSTTGDLLVAGTLESASNLYHPGPFAVVALTSAGAVDTQYGTGGLAQATGTAGTGFAYALAVTSTGETYLGGTDAADAGFQLVAFLPGGTEDTAFGTSGVATTAISGGGHISALALDGSSIVAVGEGNGEAAIGRYTSTGSADSTFNGGSVELLSLGGSYSVAASALVRADHSIVIGGNGNYTVNSNPTDCLAVAHVAANGSLDQSFGQSGIGHLCVGDDSGYALAAASDSSPIYLAGSSFDGTLSHFELARFTASGVPDTAFAPSGAVTSDPAGSGTSSGAYALLLDANAPVVGGVANQTSSPNDEYFALERYVGDATTPPVTAPPATVAAPPVDTSAPAISGSATVGATLTGSAGSWSGNPTHYVFEWLRCPASSSAGGSSPSGCQTQQNDDVAAVQDQYSVTADDAGYYMVLEVKGVNSAGDYGVAFSASTAQIPPLEPVDTSAPAISGSATVGATLTGSAGSWSGNPTHYVFEWLRCPASSSAGGSSPSGCQTQQNDDVAAVQDQYSVTADDAGYYMVLEVKGVNSAGDYGVAFSASTPSVGVPPVNAVPPSLSGPSQPHVGDSFTGTVGSWRGTQPMTYTFAWQRCPASGTPLSACVTVRKWGYSTSGAPSDTYTVASTDVGQRLLLVVWASNAAGGPVGATTKYFSPVIDSASGTIKATSQTVQTTATQVPAKLPTTKLLIGKAPTPTFSAPAAGTVTMLIDQGNLSSLIKQNPGVIAAGGGNVIAAGGGNVIAAGGGNVIAAGGGNVIAAGGGNVIAAGGGNLTRHVRGTQLTADRSHIASKSASHQVTPLKKKTTRVKPVALFRARHVFKKQGNAKLVLTLTAAGRKRLGAYEKSVRTARQHDRRLPAPMKVTLITVFTAAGLHHASVYTTRVIALTP